MAKHSAMVYNSGSMKYTKKGRREFLSHTKSILRKSFGAEALATLSSGAVMCELQFNQSIGRSLARSQQVGRSRYSLAGRDGAA